MYIILIWFFVILPQLGRNRFDSSCYCYDYVILRVTVNSLWTPWFYAALCVEFRFLGLVCIVGESHMQQYNVTYPVKVNGLVLLHMWSCFVSKHGKHRAAFIVSRGGLLMFNIANLEASRSCNWNIIPVQVHSQSSSQSNLKSSRQWKGYS